MGQDSFIKEVLLPSTLTSIDTYSFPYMELLSIDIPGNVLSIGSACFYDSTLESVVVQDGVLSIDDSFYCAFYLKNALIKTNF